MCTYASGTKAEIIHLDSIAGPRCLQAHSGDTQISFSLSLWSGLCVSMVRCLNAFKGFGTKILSLFHRQLLEH